MLTVKRRSMLKIKIDRYRPEKRVDVSDNGPRKGKKYDIWGWLLFVISALFFIASSIRNGDVIGLLGGVFFLLACVAFLASYGGRSKG